MKMKRISSFSTRECAHVFSLLRNAGIQFYARAELMGVTPAGGIHRHHIFVPEKNWQCAIDLLKEGFGINRISAAPFTGACPACGAAVHSRTECPDCGISFNPSPGLLPDSHPFVSFLDEYGLR